MDTSLPRPGRTSTSAGFSRFGKNGEAVGQESGVQPLLSIHDLDGFHKRQEQEAIHELRKRAIARWLKQLPEPDENLKKKKTMWTSFQSFGDVDDSVQALQRGNESRDLDGYDLQELAEDTPLDDFEKKSMPSEEDCPVRNLRSMRIRGHDRQMHRSLSETTAFHDTNRHSPPKSQFSKKWQPREMPCSSAHLVEVPDQPMRSIGDSLVCPALQSSPKGETSASDAWSVMSDDLEESCRKEDTAYGGSSSGSRKKTSQKRYHVKYKTSAPTISPPLSQAIEPHTSTEPRPFTAQDLKADSASYPTKEPEGEWWTPNLFFKGLVGMVCNPGWMEEQEEVESSISDEEESSDPCAMHDRVMRRLSHRKAESHRRRSLPRLPPQGRLILRMKQAQRYQDEKSAELQCQLEHPFGMKEMIPNGSQTPHPLIPPEIRVMEYLPPPSLTDLSDFECYVG